MSTSFARNYGPQQFAGRMTQWSHGIENAGKVGINAAALAAKQIFLASIAADAPSMRLRNVGKGGAKLGVRYDIKGTHNPTALIRATGPLHLLESATKAHTILPRAVGRSAGRSRGARQAGRQDLYNALFGATDKQSFLNAPALKFADEKYRGKVQHPGTSGKHPWARALPIVRSKTPEVLARAQRAEMARIFTGGAF